jgi:hypothetical protein
VSVVRGLLRRKHRDNYGRWRERRDEKKQRAEGTRQRTEGKEDCGLRIEKRHGAWGKTAGRKKKAEDRGQTTGGRGHGAKKIADLGLRI